MTALMALLLTIGVGAIAVIHVMWGLGSHWPEASEEALARSVVGDGRRRMPPSWQCFLVALVLAVMALEPRKGVGRNHLVGVADVRLAVRVGNRRRDVEFFA